MWLTRLYGNFDEKIINLNDIMESENGDKQSGISVAEKQNAKPDDECQLKRARSNPKGTLSKQQNNIIGSMFDTNNLQILGNRLVDLETALEKFQFAHKTLHSTLSDEDDIQNPTIITTSWWKEFPISNKGL